MLPSGNENHLETGIKDQTKCQIEISDTTGAGDLINTQ